MTPRTILWRHTMESESYARLVNCPVLFLDATNDQHGNMDRSFQTLDQVPTEVRWAFTPRYRHHIAAEQGVDLPLWMDAYLKGGEPFPEVAGRRGATRDRSAFPGSLVTPDLSKPVRRVDLFYAVENRNPKNRYWRSVTGQRDRRNWTASFPILDPTQPLFAFANVVYESGVCLSTNLVSVVPCELGQARATDSLSPVSTTSHDGDRRLGDEFSRPPTRSLRPQSPVCRRRTRREAGDHCHETDRPHDAQAG